MTDLTVLVILMAASIVVIGGLFIFIYWMAGKLK